MKTASIGLILIKMKERFNLNIQKKVIEGPTLQPPPPPPPPKKQTNTQT